MIKAPLPENEKQRLDSLHELKILDTDEEKVFSEITSLAGEICGTPIALITLLDDRRQWFKARVGLNATETARDLAFCAHTILQNQILEVEDSRKDKRFHDNPLVTGEPRVIFYAGTPLQTPDHLALGALCVIDHEPKKLTDLQKRALEVLGRQVSTQLELRRNLNRLAEVKAREAAMALVVSFNHEINNPLTSAKMAVELLLRQTGSDSIQNVNRQLDRIAAVVKKIQKTVEESGLDYTDYSGKTKMLKLE